MPLEINTPFVIIIEALLTDIISIYVIIVLIDFLTADITKDLHIAAICLSAVVTIQGSIAPFTIASFTHFYTSPG
jgi:hypothetical protein